ncbi:TetR/AcrR family transcriptional regulator [Chitiniphilus purpureus]|uniref:TetR/AcrR family transcriptional regulator n=1 Tax=Chitiniphilus purpureus TaxID=2981137 RepID=A0ABY6DH29_9NEIS|nr:TetR/AcrR family transcriptional regulator [Chitiniphilus sp. CD1]UXY13655.1 TetR/AcrR family transcriptional regulator [Chitiniphilus sp. CD1]
MIMTEQRTLPPHPDDAADPGRRERKRRQTLDRLAATAFALFEAQGYDAVTMEQIAAAADVAKGTLYNHFPVKEALLAHRFHAELADDLPQLRADLAGLPDFPARMTHLLHASAGWAERRRAYLPHYLRYRLAQLGYDQDGRREEARSGMDQVFEALVQAGQHAGELRNDLPTDRLVGLFRFCYLGALVRWLGEPGADLRQEFDVMLTLLHHGLATAPSGRPA